MISCAFRAVVAVIIAVIVEVMLAGGLVYASDPVPDTAPSSTQGAPASPAAGSRARRVRFGVQTPQQDTTWDDLLLTIKEAERLGFDSGWVYDHFAPIWGNTNGPALEGWTLLAALASETERIRLGVLVTGNTYRNPALLAKMATTVDHISRGRLILGIGAGWFEAEHRAYGFHFSTAKERAERLAEALQVIKKLWTQDHPSFAGKYYSLKDAFFAPRPVQTPHPPIVIGGQGKKWIVPLVGRYGDGWNAVTGVGPDGVRERIDIIRRTCREVGREPCPTDVSVLLPLLAITNVPLAGPAVRLGARAVVKKEVASAILVGSSGAIEDEIQRYVEAGANEIILSLRPPFNRDLLRRFASEVMPAFRAAGGSFPTP
jgi:F420-dependent oxidoreductase-like protein